MPNTAEIDGVDYPGAEFISDAARDDYIAALKKEREASEQKISIGQDEGGETGDKLVRVHTRQVDYIDAELERLGAKPAAKPKPARSRKPAAGKPKAPAKAPAGDGGGEDGQSDGGGTNGADA